MWLGVVYTNKFDADGKVLRRKACLVSKGHSQVTEEDFNKMYTVVVRLESLQMSAVLAAQKGYKIWQVDFMSAYLNSIPEHKIYMHLPPGSLGGEGKLA